MITKLTPELADAWNCTLLEMGMMPQAWVDKLEIYYRLGYRRTDFHDEFFATYDDMKAMLYVPCRFRAYVGKLRDIGLPKRKLAVI